MDIEAKEYTIQMDCNDLWCLAFSVKHSLQHTIKTHWVNYQNEWEEGEAKKLRLLKTMFNALGRLDVYEQIFIETEDIFKRFNDKNR